MSFDENDDSLPQRNKIDRICIYSYSRCAIYFTLLMKPQGKSKTHLLNTPTISEILRKSVLLSFFDWEHISGRKVVPQTEIIARVNTSYIVKPIRPAKSKNKNQHGGEKPPNQIYWNFSYNSALINSYYTFFGVY